MDGWIDGEEGLERQRDEGRDGGREAEAEAEGEVRQPRIHTCCLCALLNFPSSNCPLDKRGEFTFGSKILATSAQVYVK